MSDLKTKKTGLQKEFEAQTPTIKGVYGNEYNMTYCAWLEFQVEKLRKANDLETSASGLTLQNDIVSVCPKCGCNKLHHGKQVVLCNNVRCDWQTDL